VIGRDRFHRVKVREDLLPARSLPIGIYLFCGYCMKRMKRVVAKSSDQAQQKEQSTYTILFIAFPLPIVPLLACNPGFDELANSGSKSHEIRVDAVRCYA
jgi:hypothetical protein